MRFLAGLLSLLFVAIPSYIWAQTWTVGTADPTTRTTWEQNFTYDFTAQVDSQGFEVGPCSVLLQVTFDPSIGDASTDAEVELYSCPGASSPFHLCSRLPISDNLPTDGATYTTFKSPLDFVRIQVDASPVGGDTARVILRCFAQNQRYDSVTQAWIDDDAGGVGTGDMLKAQYDSNDDGKVNSSDAADALASDPQNCLVAGNAAAGIAASGAAQACFDVLEPSELDTIAEFTSQVGITGTPNGTLFLRDDGVWAATSGAPGGSDRQVQFNNAGTLGGSANLTFSATNVLSATILEASGTGGMRTLTGPLVINENNATGFGPLRIEANGNPNRVVVDSLGRLGIGVSSPGVDLDVGGAAGPGHIRASTYSHQGGIAGRCVEFDSSNPPRMVPAGAACGTGGGGTNLNTEVDSVNQSTSTSVYNWLGADFDLTESPADDFLIEIDDSKFRTGLQVVSNFVDTDSDESGFLTDLGVATLTCGAGNQGRMGVSDGGTVQYCDGATTSVQRFAALGDSSGNALTGDSATAFFSTGTVEAARLPNHDSLNGVDANDHVDHTTVTLTAGAGLTGTGDISASRTFDVGGGNGITANTDDVAIDLLDTADGTGTTSNNSGLEFQGAGSDELAMLQGCADGEILKWVESTSLWQCSADAGAAGAGIDAVEESNVLVQSGNTNLDFGAGFDVATDGATEVDVTLDYTEDPPDLSTAEVTGILTNDKGGTGIDSSALTGVPRVASGTWTADAGVSHLAASSSADLAGVLNDETGTGLAVFGTQPVLTLEQGTAPVATAEGRIQWDTDDDRIVVGDGAGVQSFFPGAHTVDTDTDTQNELDLGNDDTLENTNLVRLSTTGDTTGIVTHNGAQNEALFDMSQPWPEAVGLRTDGEVDDYLAINSGTDTIDIDLDEDGVADAQIVKSAGETSFVVPANATDGQNLELSEDTDFGTESWKVDIGQQNLSSGGANNGTFNTTTLTCLISESGRIPDACVGDGTDASGSTGVRDEGTPLANETDLNFIGRGVEAVNDPGVENEIRVKDVAYYSSTFASLQAAFDQVCGSNNNFPLVIDQDYTLTTGITCGVLTATRIGLKVVIPQGVTLSWNAAGGDILTFDAWRQLDVQFDGVMDCSGAGGTAARAIVLRADADTTPSMIDIHGSGRIYDCTGATVDLVDNDDTAGTNSSINAQLDDVKIRNLTFSDVGTCLQVGSTNALQIQTYGLDCDYNVVGLDVLEGDIHDRTSILRSNAGSATAAVQVQNLRTSALDGTHMEFSSGTGILEGGTQSSGSILTVGGSAYINLMGFSGDAINWDSTAARIQFDGQILTSSDSFQANIQIPNGLGHFRAEVNAARVGTVALGSDTSYAANDHNLGGPLIVSTIGGVSSLSTSTPTTLSAAELDVLDNGITSSEVSGLDALTSTIGDDGGDWSVTAAGVATFSSVTTTCTDGNCSTDLKDNTTDPPAPADGVSLYSKADEAYLRATGGSASKILHAASTDSDIPNDLTIESSAELGTATYVRVGHATTDASGSCVARDGATDRLYGDKDCDNTKDAGEEFLDEVPSGSTITVREIDASPSITASVLEVSNGTLTDQGGGVARVTTGGGGGGPTSPEIVLPKGVWVPDRDTDCGASSVSSCTPDDKISRGSEWWVFGSTNDTHLHSDKLRSASNYDGGSLTCKLPVLTYGATPGGSAEVVFCLRGHDLTGTLTDTPDLGTADAEICNTAETLAQGVLEEITLVLPNTGTWLSAGEWYQLEILRCFNSGGGEDCTTAGDDLAQDVLVGGLQCTHGVS